MFAFSPREQSCLQMKHDWCIIRDARKMVRLKGRKCYLLTSSALAPLPTTEWAEPQRGSNIEADRARGTPQGITLLDFRSMYCRKSNRSDGEKAYSSELPIVALVLPVSTKSCADLVGDCELNSRLQVLSITILL